MAINIFEKYPGRSNPPSVDYPQGSIKNQTAPGAKDGTPLDEAWANDKEGFFQSILDARGIIANGEVDKVGASQYYDALLNVIQSQYPYQPEVTAAATLTGSDNKIVLANIKPLLGLDKGDVISVKFSGGTSYDKLHTVESLLNDNELIVNYEHCGSRGNGSLKLPNYTGQLTVKRIVKWDSASFFCGQGYVNLASLRSLSTQYTNNSGRTIFVSVTSNQVNTDTEFRILVDGLVIQNFSRGSVLATATTVTAPVPNGSTYEVYSPPFTISRWIEGR